MERTRSWWAGGVGAGAWQIGARLMLELVGMRTMTPLPFDPPTNPQQLCAPRPD